MNAYTGNVVAAAMPAVTTKVQSAEASREMGVFNRGALEAVEGILELIGGVP